jgi:hypothetical protein
MLEYMIEIRGGSTIIKADIHLLATSQDQAEAEAEMILTMLGGSGYVDSVYQLAGTGVR